MMSFMHGCQRSVAEATYSAAILSCVTLPPPLPHDPAGPVWHCQMRIHFILLQMCSRNTDSPILLVTHGSFPVCPLTMLNVVGRVCFSHLIFLSVHTQTGTASAKLCQRPLYLQSVQRKPLNTCMSSGFISLAVAAYCVTHHHKEENILLLLLRSVSLKRLLHLFTPVSVNHVCDDKYNAVFIILIQGPKRAAAFLEFHNSTLSTLIFLNPSWVYGPRGY